MIANDHFYKTPLRNQNRNEKQETDTHYHFLLFMFHALFADQQMKQTLFKPGEIWPDTDGVHINAHGGGIVIPPEKSGREK